MTLTDLIPGVSQAKAIIGGAMVAGVLGFSLWGMRVNDLRGDHKNVVDAVVVQLKAAGYKSADEKHAADLVKALGDARDVAATSLNQCHGAVAEQNKAIEDMAASSAAKIAAGNEALAKVERGRAAAENAVSALRASAAGNEGNDGACVPSAAFLANSGNL